jgi:hypothetical protein
LHYVLRNKEIGMKKEKKDSSICVRITHEENKMVDILRDKYCTNISKFIRKTIRDTYSKMEESSEKKVPSQ